MKHLLRTALACCLLFITAHSVKAQAYIADTLYGTSGQVLADPFASVSSATSTNLIRQPDNKLLLCGNIYDISCNCNYNVMFRADCSGAIDSSFGINGVVQHTFEQRNSGADYALQPDGKILVAGTQSVSNAGSQQFPSISRYNSNGTVDTTFGTMGTTKISTFPGVCVFYSVFLQPDGKILCAGQQGYGNHLLMQFDSTGMLDNTFGNGGYVQHATPAGMSLLSGFTSVLRSDQKIVSVTSGFFDQVIVLGCYDLLGAEDSTFGTNGYFRDANFVINGGGIPKIILQSNDKVIVCRQNGAETEIKLARYNTDGSVDTTFGSQGYITFPGFRIENLFKLNNDDFIVGFANQGTPSVYKKFTANGVEVAGFTLNGTNYFEFAGGAKADIGIVSANNEFILGGSLGRMKLYKFVETIQTPPAITQSGAVLYANATGGGLTFQWYLNSSPIANATADSLEVTQNGVYMVEVQNSWGCTQSDDIELTTVGIHNTSAPVLPALYPNPVENTLNIAAAGHFQVLDLTGKVLMELNSTQPLTRIDVHQLPAGLYMLQTNTGSQTHYQRFIKQ